jgi:hypothetical protein
MSVTEPHSESNARITFASGNVLAANLETTHVVAPIGDVSFYVPASGDERFEYLVVPAASTYGITLDFQKLVTPSTTVAPIVDKLRVDADQRDAGMAEPDLNKMRAYERWIFLARTKPFVFLATSLMVIYAAYNIANAILEVLSRMVMAIAPAANAQPAVTHESMVSQFADIKDFAVIATSVVAFSACGVWSFSKEAKKREQAVDLIKITLGFFAGMLTGSRGKA